MSFTINTLSNIDHVKSLIQSNADPNQIINNTTGDTLLFYTSDFYIAEYLITASADVSYYNIYGETPIFYASNVDIAQLYIKHGARVDIISDNGKTPLYYTKMVDLLELFLDMKCDPNHYDTRGYTPLHYACNASIASKLLDSKANVNAWSIDYTTPLHMAHSHDVAHIILQHNADPNALCISHESSPLVDCQTPMHTCTNPDTALLLLKYKGDVTLRTQFEKTVLMTVSQHPDVLKIYIDTQLVDINAVDNNGNTALHYAHNKQSVHLLLDAKCNPRIYNRSGNLPIRFIRDTGALEAVLYHMITSSPPKLSSLLDSPPKPSSLLNTTPSLLSPPPSSTYSIASIISLYDFDANILRDAYRSHTESTANLRLLLEAKAPLPSQGWQLQSFLVSAAHSIDCTIMEAIIEHCGVYNPNNNSNNNNKTNDNNNQITDIFPQSIDNSTLFYLFTNFDVLSMLLRVYKLSPRADMNTSGLTLLHKVTSIECAQILLDYNADVNAVSNESFTPLHLVQRADIAQLLIDYKADMIKQDKYGCIPLQRSKNAEIYNVILTNMDKMSLLYNDLSSLPSLSSSSSSSSQSDKCNLYKTCSFQFISNVSSLEILRKYGIIPTLAQLTNHISSHDTPNHNRNRAIISKSYIMLPIIHYLIKYNGDINSLSSTPLEVPPISRPAVCDWPVIKLLLDHNADISIISSFNSNILHHYAMEPHRLQYILDYIESLPSSSPTTTTYDNIHYKLLNLKDITGIIPLFNASIYTIEMLITSMMSTYPPSDYYQLSPDNSDILHLLLTLNHARRSTEYSIYDIYRVLPRILPLLWNLAFPKIGHSHIDLVVSWSKQVDYINNPIYPRVIFQLMDHGAYNTIDTIDNNHPLLSTLLYDNIGAIQQ